MQFKDSKEKFFVLSLGTGSVVFRFSFLSPRVNQNHSLNFPGGGPSFVVDLIIVPQTMEEGVRCV